MQKFLNVLLLPVRWMGPASPWCSGKGTWNFYREEFPPGLDGKNPVSQAQLLNSHRSWSRQIPVLRAAADGGAKATPVFQDPVPAIIPPKPQSYFCFLPPTLSISPLANIDFPQFPAALIKQLPKGLPRGPLLLFVEQKNHQHCLQSAPASAAWD